jgi:hypothetical protein
LPHIELQLFVIRHIYLIRLRGKLPVVIPCTFICMEGSAVRADLFYWGLGNRLFVYWGLGCPGGGTENQIHIKHKK